jgi:hypothetical protein
VAAEDVCVGQRRPYLRVEGVQIVQGDRLRLDQVALTDANIERLGPGHAQGHRQGLAGVWWSSPAWNSGKRF